MDQLEGLAKSSQSMQGFLDALPKDSLPSFTFVTNSLSVQRGNEKSDKHGQGKVTPLWPRVLRTSADGKITLSFVCDPKNPAYGKVEALYFDDALGKVQSREFDFGGAAAPHAGDPHHNPQRCIGCHGTSDTRGDSPPLKFIWPEYFQWGDCVPGRGITMYGANDDNLDPDASPRTDDLRPEAGGPDCNADKIIGARNKEMANFAKFREMQKDNPCFQSLPWPDRNPASLAPYGSGGRDSPANRPNLRTTVNYASWTAKSLAHRMANGSPRNYALLKYYLVMSRVPNCLTEPDKDQIRRLTGVDYADYMIADDFLRAAAEKSGLPESEFTLEFRGKHSDYRTGSQSLENRVVREVFRGIAQENPRLAQEFKNRLDDGFAQYGTSLACMKDTVSTLNNFPNPDLCKLLHDENDKSLRALASRPDILCATPPVDSPIPNLAAASTAASKKLLDDSLARGKKLAGVDGKGKCVSCHSPGKKTSLKKENLLFFPDVNDKKHYKTTAAKLREKQGNGFSDTVDLMLQISKEMPPFKNDLTDSEREDIDAYLHSLGK